MTNQELPDTYSLIRSQEIQEYYRKNVMLSVEQQVSIITHCYSSMQEQLEWLELLANGLTGESKQYVEGMLSLYEIMLTLFYHPEKIYPTGKIIYCVRREVSKSNITKNADIKDVLKDYTVDVEHLCNTVEVMEYINQCGYDKGIFIVDMLIMFEGKGLTQLAGYHIESVGGEYVPIRCSLYDNADLEQLEDIIQKYQNDSVWRHRLDLPFAHGSKVKLKLPSMSEPIYGILWRELDGNQCWYNFFYPEGTSEQEMERGADFLDMSYINIGMISDYSVLDWLECAE